MCVFVHARVPVCRFVRGVLAWAWQIGWQRVSVVLQGEGTDCATMAGSLTARETDHQGGPHTQVSWRGYGQESVCLKEALTPSSLIQQGIEGRYSTIFQHAET